MVLRDINKVRYLACFLTLKHLVMLSNEKFLQAMTIITLGHSNKVEINRVAGQTVVENKENVRLELTDCTPATVNRLKAVGFTLGMKDGRMTVDFIG